MSLLAHAQCVSCLILQRILKKINKYTLHRITYDKSNVYVVNSKQTLKNFHFSLLTNQKALHQTILIHLNFNFRALAWFISQSRTSFKLICYAGKGREVIRWRDSVMHQNIWDDANQSRDQLACQNSWHELISMILIWQ